jgi:hypothetical protein
MDPLIVWRVSVFSVIFHALKYGAPLKEADTYFPSAEIEHPTVATVGIEGIVKEVSVSPNLLYTIMYGEESEHVTIYCPSSDIPTSLTPFPGYVEGLANC